MADRSQNGTNRIRDAIARYCSSARQFSPARRLYLLLGWCFFGLGAVGTVVPGLPTTPFMLLALWAFSKSSERFHAWLYAHPTFGPPLQHWCTHRVIPLKAKLLSICMMALSFVYLGFFTDIGLWIKILIALLMLYGAAFILSKPSRVPESAVKTPPARNHSV